MFLFKLLSPGRDPKWDLVDDDKYEETFKMYVDAGKAISAIQLDSTDSSTIIDPNLVDLL